MRTSFRFALAAAVAAALAVTAAAAPRTRPPPHPKPAEGEAAAEVPPATLTWKPNVDIVGAGPDAWLDAAGWAKVQAAVPTLAAPDAGLDAFAFRGPAHPKAPRRLELGGGPEVASRGVSLLLAYRGDLPRGAPILRVTRTPTGGPAVIEDLRAGEGLSSLTGGVAADRYAAVDAGNGRVLSVVYVEPTDAVTLDVRVTEPDVVLLGAHPGRVVELPMATRHGLDGFPFPITIHSPGAPVPSAWAVPPNAGSRGKLAVKDGHLAWPDGTRARFWGVNLLTVANYPTHELADALAVQLAANGVNLVRMHHADAPASGGLNPARKSASDPLFLDEGLDRFDYLVSKLEAAGVYIELEIATNRAFTTADGVNDPGPEIPNGHKLLPMFEPAWRTAYLEWTKAWLGRTNRYTGKRYADDPGVAMVELTNENSLVMNWLTGGTERLPAVHRAELDRQWNDFLRARYPDDAAMAAKWTGSVNPGLRPGEGLGHVARLPAGQGSFGQYPRARVADLYDFYLGLEVPFFDAVRDAVRGLGYTQPLTGGITYTNAAVAQTMARYDVIDTHLEWDASASGSFRNESFIANPRSQQMISRFAIAQAGKPMMVSELNEGFPNDHMSEAPLLWASLASEQDWDAVIWLNYTNGPITEGPDGVASFSEMRFAAVKWAQMATASGLFRSGAVPAADGLLPIWRSPAAVKAEIVEQQQLDLLELRDVGTFLRARYREAYGDAPPLPIAGTPSTTLGWWPDAERFVVQTPALEAVLGDHGLRQRAGAGEGSGPTRAAHLDPQLDGVAAVSLTCLDGEVSACKGGLLSVAGRMENRGMQRIGGGSVILADGGDAVVLTRPSGAVRFAWPRKPEVRPMDAAGVEGAPVPVTADGAGWWSLPMSSAGSTLWWRVR